MGALSPRLLGENGARMDMLPKWVPRSAIVIIMWQFEACPRAPGWNNCSWFIPLGICREWTASNTSPSVDHWSYRKQKPTLSCLLSHTDRILLKTTTDRKFLVSTKWSSKLWKPDFIWGSTVDGLQDHSKLLWICAPPSSLPPNEASWGSSKRHAWLVIPSP